MSLLTLIARLDVNFRNFINGRPRDRREFRARWGHVLPRGNSLRARIWRSMILTLDEVEHGLPQIQLPLRMLLYFFFWPIFLFSAVIRVPFGRSALVRAPASRVLAVLRFVLPRKVFDRIFAQLVQDFRDEYIAELSAGRLWRARWMHVCFYLTLLLTILVWGGASVAKMAVKLWQMSG